MSSSEPQAEPAGDAIAEVYHGRRYDLATQRAARERIHWICGQARGPSGHPALQDPEVLQDRRGGGPQDRLEGGERVLDVGCSQGIVCLLLAREGIHCVGVDTRAEAVAYAQAEAAKEPPAVQARLEYRETDGTRLDFEDACFDSVILGELLEHVVQPERVLAEAVRVLRPGGRLVVTTPLGLLPDPDHKQTFWFSNVVPLLESFARTEACGTIPGAEQYIGYVGVKAPPTSSLADLQTVRNLLRETERTCQAREQDLERWLADARERAAETRRRHDATLLRLQRQQEQALRLYEAERERMAAQLRAKEEVAQNLLAALQMARDELGVITHSRGYQMLLRLRRFKREFLGGPWRVRAAYLGDIARKVARPLRGRHGGPSGLAALGRSRPGEPPPAPPSPSEEYERGVEAFLQRVARHPGDRFVVMFCATHYIQENRGNRPMRMAQLIAGRDIPVLYYFEGLPEEPAPPPVHPLIHECPIGLGFAHLEKVARAQVGRKRRLLIASFPYPECARHLDALHALGWTTVYECRDEWEEFHKAGRLDRWFGYDPEAERYLAAHADVVCAVSRPLVEKLQAVAGSRPVHLSPNAYDTLFLSPENAGRLAPRSGPPVVGYFGHLSPDWFDWDALCEMARRRPEWQFDIVGDPHVEKASPPENVRLLGLRSHAEINRLAQPWRAAIIPFKINALTRAVDPIKIYEYLALGLPTVGFTMPQIEDYPYTFTVDSVEAFLARAEEAMAMPLDRAVIDRFLEANRWEDRVDQLLAWADAARTDAP